MCFVIGRIKCIIGEKEFKKSSSTSSNTYIDFFVWNTLLYLSTFPSDMILPTLQNVTIWRATRCGLPNITQNFSKMPKLTGKNWRFGDEKPNLVAPSNCMSLVLNERTRLMQLDGATRFGFSSPNLQFLPVNFGIFEKFWVIFGKPHLVARQNRTIWPVGKIMSGSSAVVNCIIR